MYLRIPRCFLLVPLLLSGCYESHQVERFDAGALDAVRGADSGADTPDAATVDPRCTLVKQGELLAAHEGQGSLNAPDLFWTGERIGMVLHADRAGGFEHGVVVAADVDPGLTEASELRLVGEESHGWGEAAWNGEGYGVCWYGDQGGNGQLRFREVAQLDGALGPQTVFGEGSSSCLDLAFSRGRYGMAWRHRYQEGEEYFVETRLQLLERDGSQIGDVIALGNGPSPGVGASVQPLADGFVAVAPGTDSIRLVRLSGEGAVLRDQSVNLPGAVYGHIAARGEEFGVLALSGERETRSLWFLILNSAFEVTHRRQILDGAPTASRPRIAARPEGWTLLWGAGSRPSYRAMMLSLDPSGVPLAPRTEFYSGGHSGYGGPSTVSVDDALFIGISHVVDGATPGAREYTHVERWECIGEPEDLCAPQEVSTAGDCERSTLVGWRWSGSRCEAVYGCDTACRGRDCDRLSQSRFACESDRTECATLSCETAETSANQICGQTEILSNQPSWFDLEYGGEDTCPCEQPTCVITPTANLELTVSLPYCVDEVPDCDCYDPDPPRPTVACALPPLAPGEWTINLPDRESVQLTVRPIWEMTEGSELCR